jgi:hypothetical protein
LILQPRTHPRACTGNGEHKTKGAAAGSKWTAAQPPDPSEVPSRHMCMPVHLIRKEGQQETTIHCRPPTRIDPVARRCVAFSIQMAHNRTKHQGNIDSPLVVRFLVSQAPVQRTGSCRYPSSLPNEVGVNLRCTKYEEIGVFGHIGGVHCVRRHQRHVL